MGGREKALLVLRTLGLGSTATLAGIAGRRRSETGDGKRPRRLPHGGGDQSRRVSELRSPQPAPVGAVGRKTPFVEYNTSFFYSGLNI